MHPVPSDCDVLIGDRLTKKGLIKIDPQAPFLGPITPPLQLKLFALLYIAVPQAQFVIDPSSCPQKIKKKKKSNKGGINPAPSDPDCQDARIFSSLPS